MRGSDPAGKAEGESESEGRIYTETDQGRIKMKEQHSESENRTELYEDVLLGKKLWTRLYRKLFWNGVSKKQIVKAMLKYIPEDFKGRLLDVPAGTGLFTYRKYSWMRDARIICYDEDEEMLDLAKKRFARDGLDHVTVKKGNCAKLPFRNESFDAVDMLE